MTGVQTCALPIYTDNGQNQVTAEDLPAIEAEMMKIVKENLPLIII